MSKTISKLEAQKSIKRYLRKKYGDEYDYLPSYYRRQMGKREFVKQSVERHEEIMSCIFSKMGVEYKK